MVPKRFAAAGNLALLVTTVLAACTSSGAELIPVASGTDVVSETPVPAQAAPVAAAESEVGQWMPAPLEGLQPTIAAILAEQPGEWGLQVVDLVSVSVLSFNAEGEFLAASTIKLFVVVHVLREIEALRGSFQDVIALEEGDWQEGSGILQNHLPGEVYAVEELLALAIQESDNVANNMLLRHFGGWLAVDRIAEVLGMRLRVRDDNWQITPRQMATLLVHLWNDPALLTRENRERLLGWMANTVFEDRLVAGVRTRDRPCTKSVSWMASTTMSGT